MWRLAPLAVVALCAPAKRTSLDVTTTQRQRDQAYRDYQRYCDAINQPILNVPQDLAQATQAVTLKNLLSKTDIQRIHKAAQELTTHKQSNNQNSPTIDRSAWGQPKGTWLVTFLNSGGAFEKKLPELHQRIKSAALQVDREYWNVTTGIKHVNYRVVEYHTMRSMLGGQPTGGGLHTRRHCDHGSLITVDIILTNPAEFEGGVLQTLEPGGELLNHEWEQGDALVFLSHKFHCVSELTRGTRQVLVLELWQGSENLSPSRDESLRWLGELRE